MANKKQKLELTWVGKDNRPKLEPRILIEDPEKSYHASERRSDDDIFDNMLIHGDNLLALKALEQDYAGKVKCIYIDPPFNTGAAFENYEDGLEHSLWLGLLSERLKILKTLLCKEGSIFLHLDDNEVDYAKVIMDEVFGRKNFVNRITVEARAPSAFSTVNPGVFKASEYILWFAKDKAHFQERSGRVKRNPDYAYNKWLTNPNASPDHWKFKPLLAAYEEAPQSRSRRPDSLFEHFNRFIIENADRICRFAEISDSGAGKDIVDLKYRSKNEPNSAFMHERAGFEPIYVMNGQQILFYSKNVAIVDGELSATSMMTNIWTDIGWEGIAKEGGVTFRKGKKPEKLIKRCLELATEPSDLVLDTFAGSGTTGAVAQKMRRRWIMVELGDHADTHCLPRLKRVVSGEDNSGITSLVEWQGGGGFRFFRLAPSLLERDKYGNWIISKDYKPEMLAEAMCKHMGFTYAPSQNPEEYWNQGYSTETDFIYVTTQNLTHQALAKISEDVGVDRSLLICCKAFNANPDAFENLTIKKIPHAVLKKCEWGRDDYSLNVANLPMAGEEDVHLSVPPDDLPLFASEEVGGEG